MFACSTLFLIGNVGVPIKLLHEAEGMKVTVEVSILAVTWSSTLCQTTHFLCYAIINLCR